MLYNLSIHYSHFEPHDLGNETPYLDLTGAFHFAFPSNNAFACSLMLSILSSGAIVAPLGLSFSCAFSCSSLDPSTSFRFHS